MGRYLKHKLRRVNWSIETIPKPHHDRASDRADASDGVGKPRDTVVGVDK